MRLAVVRRPGGIVPVVIEASSAVSLPAEVCWEVSRSATWVDKVVSSSRATVSSSVVVISSAAVGVPLAESGRFSSAVVDLVVVLLGTVLCSTSVVVVVLVPDGFSVAAAVVGSGVPSPDVVVPGVVSWVVEDVRSSRAQVSVGVAGRSSTS